MKTEKSAAGSDASHVTHGTTASVTTAVSYKYNLVFIKSSTIIIPRVYYFL